MRSSTYNVNTCEKIRTSLISYQKCPKMKSSENLSVRNIYSTVKDLEVAQKLLALTFLYAGLYGVNSSKLRGTT